MNVFLLVHEQPSHSHPASITLHGPEVCEVDGCVATLRFPEQMRNDPCFAAVAFGLIDYKQRPFNKQRCCILTMQHSIVSEITHIARVKTAFVHSLLVICVVIKLSFHLQRNKLQ